jgi:hypothetical protein
VTDKKKINKRKFKVTTPGQIRDFDTLVKNRGFKRYEEVENTEEDAPANSIAGGGVDMAPNAKGTKVYFKRRRLDGRTKDYRETVARIRQRQQITQERQLKNKLSMFGVMTNPFVKEDKTMDNKYLKIKEGSLEAAVVQSVGTEVEAPKETRPTLHLPEKKYLKTKEGSLEDGVVAVLAQIAEAGYDPDDRGEKKEKKVRITRRHMKHEIGQDDKKDDEDCGGGA